MKRIAIVIVSGLIAASAATAQAWGGPQGFGGPGPMMGQPQLQTQEVVKVEGKLALINGMIAVKDKDKTYYVGGLDRLVGFIDGLKEGASVKLEGYAFAIPGAPEYLHLRATKLTLNGKDYDLSQTFGRGMMGGGMGGRWDDDDSFGRGMGGQGYRR